MGPLNCSLDPLLGDYYQDFSAAVDLVEAGYHGGLDANGVALTDYGEQGSFYNAIITGQYALGLMTGLTGREDPRADRARAQLDSLAATQETGGELEGCW